MAEIPLTIAEAAAWIRAGRITSVALTEALLTRAHAAQEALGAFVRITDDSALAAARAADAAFAAGIDRGPLQGIPLGIKDLLATRDAPTTANSRVLDPAWGQRDDASVVRKLRAAGAVLMGKLTLSEYAIGWPDPETGFPIPRNPWDTARFPGGSSSGTGAAVAAGLILGGLGSDTGGSVRGPASFCGITGLKVTFGRVSKEGCVPLGYALDTIGPMARSARDCALMMGVMAGYDPADPSSANVPVPDYLGALTGSLAGVRIGVPAALFETPELDAEVRAAVQAAIDAMQAAGAVVRPIEVPYLDEGRTVARVTMIAEAFAYHLPDLRTRPHLYGKYTRLSFLQGALYTAADYVQAQRVRSLVRDACIAAMADYDVIVTPTSLNIAPRYDTYDPDAMITTPSLTGYWNVTGMPALSVPCGFNRDGLPIGMQIVGKPFADDTVLVVGDAYQGVTDWHRRVPDVPALKEVTA